MQYSDFEQPVGDHAVKIARNTIKNEDEGVPNLRGKKGLVADIAQVYRRMFRLGKSPAKPAIIVIGGGECKTVIFPAAPFAQQLMDAEDAEVLASKRLLGPEAQRWLHAPLMDHVATVEFEGIASVLLDNGGKHLIKYSNTAVLGPLPSGSVSSLACYTESCLAMRDSKVDLCNRPSSSCGTVIMAGVAGSACTRLRRREWRSRGPV